MKAVLIVEKFPIYEMIDVQYSAIRQQCNTELPSALFSKQIKIFCPRYSKKVEYKRGRPVSRILYPRILHSHIEMTFCKIEKQMR